MRLAVYIEISASNVAMEARVTLILGEDRVEVSRDDLTSKSEYFASLLSGNFRDSLSNEYHINYDINGKTLRVRKPATLSGST